MRDDPPSDLEWIQRRITIANYFGAAYLFCVLAQAGFVYADLRNFGRVSPENLILPFILAGFYLLPFVVNVILFSLWRKLFHPQLNDIQIRLCYVGVWLSATILYFDMMFYLPFESGSAAEKQMTIRLLTPVINGFVLSPIINLLGVVVGLGGYHLSHRGKVCNGRPLIATFALFLTMSLVLFVLTYAFGSGGFMIGVGLIISGVLGHVVKRYSERSNYKV